ncbi:hypothetical protein [Cystobacter ferrugineus]|uniref:Knr4/Smi1-like domain-containing protein n=1 Tax=Cystobacter ferrugineus TaxID=83449 RepID=A0A1L9B4X2_9BACT|nr:hypothetical protein [Cystobacter ferrugineus]OJH37301.1 hypothetical protein BON30_28800 [Cystobacter ferrugineus]
MDAVLLERFRALTKVSDKVVLYPGAELRMIMRTEGNLPGYLDPELVSFCKFTNGMNVLDCCFAGCKNREIGDVANNTLNLWKANDLLAGCFVGFMRTSSGAHFGYLSDFPGSAGTHPVAVLRNVREPGVLVLTTSISKFLESLVDEVEWTLEHDKKALRVAKEGWPMDLEYWLARDPALAELYKSGKLSKYYAESQTVREIVDRNL